MDSAATGSVAQQVGAAYSILSSPSTSVLNYGYRNSGSGGLVARNGAGLIAGDTLSFTARVPIAGWQDYGVIVGSFAGIEKCANDYECTDTFSAKLTAGGVVSDENLDWISGNASISTTSTYAITFNSGIFTVAPNCVVLAKYTTTDAANVTPFIRQNTSSTTFTYRTTNGSTAAAIASDVDIICQKQGVDYKPKTAKVASSNGVPTVPGLTGSSAVSVDTFSLSYGGATASTVCSANPCTIYTQIGTAVTSVGWAAGPNYTVNFSKTYSIVNCIVQPFSTSTQAMATTNLKGTSVNNLTWSSTVHSSGSGANTYGTLICQGTY